MHAAARFPQALYMTESAALLQDATGQPSNPQSVLQIHGLDLRIDPSWVDGGQSPGGTAASSNSGSSPVLQQVWSAVQPNGFDLLRIPLDIRDSQSATRAVNLCSWAKNNNLKLIFVLTGADPGQQLPSDYPKVASEFLKALVGQFRATGDQSLANYSQIMAFQIDNELNHPGQHGGMTSSNGVRLGLEAAKSLHKAQKDALSGTSLQAVPLAVSASFDFPLIQAGAISGVSLTDAEYAKAYQELKNFLTALAASSDIDFLAVDWFAGSLSAGSPDQFQPLLEKLLADLPSKLLMFSTGFSPVGHPPDQQPTFIASFLGLGNFCSNRGSDCRFAGTIYHEALDAPGTIPGDGSAPWQTWDWSKKAAELTTMWTGKKTSDDLTHWLAAVQNSMGLVTLQSDGSQPASSTQAPAAQGSTPSPGTFDGQQQPSSNPTPSAGDFGSQTQYPASNPGALPNSGNNTSCIPQPDPSAGSVSPSSTTATCQSSGFKQVIVNGVGLAFQQTMTQVATAIGQKLTTGSGSAVSANYPGSQVPLNNPPGSYGAGSNLSSSYGSSTSVQPFNAPTGSAVVSTGPLPMGGSGTASQANSSGASASSTQSTQGAFVYGQTITVAGGTSNSTNQTTTSAASGSSVPPAKQAGVVPTRSPVGTMPGQGSTVSNSQSAGLPALPPRPGGNAANQSQVAGVPAQLPIRQANSQTAALPSLPPRPIGTAIAGTGAVDLSVVGTGIFNMTPAHPSAGQTVMFAVNVSNLGSQATQNASATFVLFATSKELSRSQPIRFSIGGGRAVSPVRWAVVLPQAGLMSVRVTVIDTRDVNPGNNANTFQFFVANR